jgi:hypothetical protein
MILHVAPYHVDIRPGQGSHKDVAARRAFFAASGMDYRYINVRGDDPAHLVDIFDSCTPSHVLIEYSYYPKIVTEIRRRFPDAYIAIRAHNIEPLQEWTLAERDGVERNLRNVYAFFRLLIGDIRIACAADHVFVISPVEADQYWRWLGIRRKVTWLPYIPPSDMVRAADDERRNVIACLPGGAQSRRTIDLVNRFGRFAQAAKDVGWPQRFVVTGNIDGWPVKLTDAVERLGYVDDLKTFYGSVKAVAVLSPVGYGFKTTIADAILSGAMVLVHPKIGDTLPQELMPHCVTLAGLGAADLARAEALLRSTTGSGAAADALDRRFEQEMGRFMRGKAAL